MRIDVFVDTGFSCLADTDFIDIWCNYSTVCNTLVLLYRTFCFLDTWHDLNWNCSRLIWKHRGCMVWLNCDNRVRRRWFPKLSGWYDAQNAFISEFWKHISDNAWFIYFNFSRFIPAFLSLCFVLLWFFVDASSLNGFESEARLSVSSLKDATHGGSAVNASSISFTDQHPKGPKSGEQSTGNPEKNYVSHDDVSSLSLDEDAGREEGGILDNCGILPNNCLPCLASTAPTAEKRRSLSSSPPNSTKKTSLKLSFKRKLGEGHAAATLCECSCSCLNHLSFYVSKE